jgi:hypothetical protein
MRNFTKTAAVTVAFLLSGRGAMAQGPNLKDLYGSGHVNLIKKARIDESALPKGIVFENLRGLAADARGNVYAADFSANHILVFDSEGKFLRTIGRKGQGPGDLGGPEAIAISSGRIAVREVFNNRLSLFNTDGEFTTSAFFDPDARNGGFINMKVMPDGRLAVFAERGLPQGFSGPLPEDQVQAVDIYSADLKTKKTIYEKSFHSSRWYRNPETGSFRRVRFPYHPRVLFDVSPSGTIALGYSARYEIGFYDPDGGRVAACDRPYGPVKVEERDRKEFFDSFVMSVIVGNARKVLPKPPDYIVKLAEFPEYLPPYRGGAFDSEDNLWVQLYTTSRATNVFDVFSSKGEFVHRIVVDGAPINKNFTEGFDRVFFKDTIWQVERDSEGNASIVKYLMK